MEDKVLYWLDISEYDLETAKAMLITQRYLYVGFMCHQVVEKSLKAVIASKGLFPPKIHNLFTLASKADLTSRLSETQNYFMSSISSYNIESRYPQYRDKLFQTLTKVKCENMINETEEFYKWITEYLKQANNLQQKSEEI